MEHLLILLFTLSAAVNVCSKITVQDPDNNCELTCFGFFDVQCGTDDITYPSTCHMLCENRGKTPAVTSARRGRCDDPVDETALKAEKAEREYLIKKMSENELEGEPTN